MSDQQTALAAAAVMRGSPTMTEIQFAITGEPIADLMAGMRVLCDHSQLSARQIQFIFECYAKLYKDAADQNDRNLDAAKSPPMHGYIDGYTIKNPSGKGTSGTSASPLANIAGSLMP